MSTFENTKISYELEEPTGELILKKARNTIDNWEALEPQLRPVIDFAVRAHEGIDGLDGKPLALHSADVMCSPLLHTME